MNMKQRLLRFLMGMVFAAATAMLVFWALNTPWGTQIFTCWAALKVWHGFMDHGWKLMWCTEHGVCGGCPCERKNKGIRA